MRGASLGLLVAVSLVAGRSLDAQGSSAAVDGAALRADLGGERSLFAVRRLVAVGAPVVDPLVQLAQRCVADGNGERRECLMAIYALAKIGESARPVAPRLFALLAQAPRGSDLQRQLVWAIGELGAGSVSAEELRRLEPLIEPGWNAQEWNIAIARLQAGSAFDREQVLQLLEQRTLAPLVAGADLLLQPDAAVDDELRAALNDAFRAIVKEYSGPEYSWDRGLHELARAVAQHTTDAALRVEALGLLVRHFDPDVRFETVRRLAGGGAAAVDPLLVALGDGEAEVRAEAIAALGTLGADALPAVSALERLARSDDRGLALRAQASLRQIEGKPK